MTGVAYLEKTTISRTPHSGIPSTAAMYLYRDPNRADEHLIVQLDDEDNVVGIVGMYGGRCDVPARSCISDPEGHRPLPVQEPAVVPGLLPKLCPLASALGVAILTIATEAAAQVQPHLQISEVDATAPEPFSLLKGLRELSDGRVIVSDWIEERVVVVDFAAGTTRDVGGIGAGPQEFRLPDRLVALPGDSTLLIDVGNGRLMLLGPDLRFARTMSVREHGEPYSMTPKAADSSGALYFQLSPWWVGFEAGRKDSVPVARWLPGKAVQMVGGTLIKASTSRGPGRSVGIPYIPFAKQDGWAAFPDGAVAVVRSQPYRVEWYSEGGNPVIGPTIPYQQLPVTENDRRAHVRAFLMGAPQSGRGQDGGMGHVTADQQSQQEIDRIVREATFAEEFPPFVPGGVWATYDGLLWVERSLPVTAPPQFDVFDRSGNRVATVALPHGRSIIGFGNGVVYAVAADSDELLTLERYSIPPIGS